MLRKTQQHGKGEQVQDRFFPKSPMLKQLGKKKEGGGGEWRSSGGPRKKEKKQGVYVVGDDGNNGSGMARVVNQPHRPQ
jgi:hypothetical protein